MEKMKVMVVDDAAYMRMVMRSIVEELGHQVVAEASSGTEAVRMYQSVRPDLITMDITMPDMDGAAVVKRIKTMDSRAKIVMCSATGQREMVLDAIRSGASGYVVKPIQKERVYEAICHTFSRT